MIKVLLIALFVHLASGQYGHAPAAYGPAPIATYAKPAYVAEVYTKPQPYNFGYDVNDGYGNSMRQQEDGDDYGNKRGSYGYTDAYGIYRQVDYVADEHGFRAQIRTNEPGTAAASPADVQLDAAPVQVAHAPSYAAPAYAAPAYAPAPAFLKAPAYHAPKAYRPAPIAIAAPAYRAAPY